MEEYPGISGPDDFSRKLGEDVYSGSGDFVIEDIFDFRRFVDAFGPEKGEELLNECTPHGEPYVRGPVEEDDEPINEKIRKRAISISGEGQGHDMGAYLGMVDDIKTHYKFNPVIKVVDSLGSSPLSQVNQEMQQRRQQAEQQINRTLGNLADLYQQKQLLEHDMRKLEARLEHVEEAAASDDERDTQDELKADFVDLVDQHTGRHSILQMQANNVFPSITADFYQMTSLDDLEAGGPLEDLPENEKAVLRKKWKLYEQWKNQFQTAVRSRYQDVQTRLNSVETSIEQTKEWIKPYVQDIIQITSDWRPQFELSHNLSRYLPQGYANVYRQMKIIAAKDQTPGHDHGLYYDVVIITPMQGALSNPENPQQAGQGLVVFHVTWHEYLVCKHVYEAVFEAQMDAKKNEVEEYIEKYTGEEGITASREEIEEKKEALRERFGIGEPDEDDGKGSGLKLGASDEDMAERIANASTMDELENIEDILEYRAAKPTAIDRSTRWLRELVGATDEFYHPDPSELRRELMGPGFPTQFYLDYKYGNDLFVMK